MTCRLVALEIENFRGFRDRERIDLDADIVLVRGDNGSGKTSLTDGILWVLTGELTHIKERVRGLRHTHDAVQNRYSDAPSRVALTVRDSTSTWTFVRTGSARTSELKGLRDGQAIDAEEWMPRIFGENDLGALRLAVITWGILRQDAVRSVLDTGGAALHERMASVIGLAEVTRFQDACRSMTKRATAARAQAKTSRDSARDAFERATTAVASQANIARNKEQTVALVERLNSAANLLKQDLSVEVSGIETLDEVVAFGQHIAALLDLAVSAADAFDEYVQASAMATDDAESLEQELHAAEIRAGELSRATSERQRLAELAINLLSEHCPVCDQTIDEGTVRAKLLADLKNNSRRLLQANEAGSLAEMIRQRLQQARANQTRKAAAWETLQARTRILNGALSESARVNVQGDQEQANLRLVARRLETLRDSLRRLHGEMQATQDVARTRLLATVEAARLQLEEMELALSEANARETSSKSLEKRTQAAADQIIARWLSDLEPSFAEVFDRLSPHPTFSMLRARQDVYYGKNQIVPEVVDPVRGVTANPLLVYSEGQLNTVAISYFLGLALNAPTTGIGFMVMDDPLQSMDVLAVLGFADLCRRLRRERQLLLTTHDRRYADLLGRKLSPRERLDRTISHEFENWSASGPQVTTTRHDGSAAPVVLLRRASA